MEYRHMRTAGAIDELLPASSLALDTRSPWSRRGSGSLRWPVRPPRTEKSHRCRLALLAAVLCGCGASTLALHHARVIRSAGPRVPVALRVIDGNARIVVPGRLGEVAVAWEIDTGASGHAVNASTANRHGLLPASARALSVNVVPNGSMVVERRTEPVAVSVFGGPRPPASPITIAGDERSAAAGIAGVLSPQRFAPADGAVELDVPHRALIRLDHDATVRARDELTRLGARLDACRDGGGRSVPMVGGTVEGVRVRFIVDTGSPATVLYADTVAGVDASLRATSHVVQGEGGNESDVAIVPGVRIRVAGASAAVRAAVLSRWSATATAFCGADGLLGLDVLRGCAILLDSSGGALACESPVGQFDTAPALARMPALPLPRGLAAEASRRPAGIVASLGCESVTDEDVASWARDRGVPIAEARDRAVRARIFAHLARSLLIAVTPDEIDRAIESVRVQNGLDAEALEAELARRHMTMESYRSDVAEQLVELKVANALLPESRVSDADVRADLARRGVEEPYSAEVLDSTREALFGALSTAKDALAARVGDRLARAALVREGGSCREDWPRYYPSQIDFVGLAADDVRVVRLSVERLRGRWLAGGTISLGVAGTLPASLANAVAQALPQSRRRVRVAAHEEGARLRVTVEAVR